MNARPFARLRCVAFLAAVLAAPAEGDDLETPVLKHCPVDQWTATNNYPTLGIDDLTVSWECALPDYTVIVVQ